MVTGPYSGSASGSMSLTTIARYFSQKPVLTLIDRTETTATFSWSTSENCSYVQYRINNGGWVDVESNINKRSGTYTITGLTPNTQYLIRGDFQRKDSGLWSSHGGYDVRVDMQTYNYPNCTNGSNFVIGESCTLDIDNPLNKTYNLIFEMENEETITISGLTGTTYTGFNDNTSITKLFQSIPNNTTGNYSITITTDTPSSVESSNVGTYIVADTNNNRPIFSNYTYQDTNTDSTTGTTRLTGDNTVLIANYSTVKALISTSNKATSQNYSTMTDNGAGYKFVIGTESPITAQYSDNSTVELGNILATNNVLNVYAIDSRGLSTLVSKELEIGVKYIEYQDLVITSATVSRDNGGAGEDVTLDIRGTFWNNSFGTNANAVTNHIKSITYEYKETNASTWTTGLTTITATETNNSYRYNNTIRGDLVTTGFDVTKSYNIRVTVKDELSTQTYMLTLGAGTPAIAIASGNGVAIGGKYNTTLGGALQVVGQMYINGTEPSTVKALPFNTTEDKDINAPTINATISKIEEKIAEDNTYSTTETVVGTWINNKPIYRMILTGTRSSGTIFYVSPAVSCDQLIKVDAYAQTSTQAWGLYRVNDTDQFRYYVDRLSPLRLTFLNGSSNPPTSFTYKVIVEYTKTTD